MFTRILIANRGEIACRVITTARRLGVATVAVYSDADANARHVAMADEAVRIGSAPAAESYLRGDAIVEAAKRTQAQAIHPGYGFLSENPGFVEAVESAGLVFIGPPASAIRSMGLKDAAKSLMEKAGVPVVPGYHGEIRDPEFLAGEAKKIGYPVLIKARAGGGGKGMRLVENHSDFKTVLESAEREAAASFGDPACLIEKYISSPRHVEIQIFADNHGNVVHLFERDCSLQRRHQKVIEEAPAPGMPENVRNAMGAAAVEAARAIGYRGAGTVEFIADGSQGLRTDGFWFMEMNTRLQVEHPVTEAITGIDLVELQLRIAGGEPLPFAQQDLKIDGHAFEARLYAEDVPKGFLPATGTLEHLEMPAGSEFAASPVRVDSGVRQGDTITPFYDPMIAKLIVHGSDRTFALNRLASALGECRIAGTVTNIAFLGALARHPDFIAGQVDTGLIGRDIGLLSPQLELSEDIIAIAALAGLGMLSSPKSNHPWEQLSGWRHWSDAKQYALLEHDGKRIECGVIARGKGRYTIESGTRPLDFQVEGDVISGLRLNCDGHVGQAHVAIHDNAVTVFRSGKTFQFTLPDLLAGEAEADAAGDVVVAPMPGLVKLVRISAHDQISKGDPLVVLEAMKMEHTLTAERDGIVESILVQEGEQVTGGTVLLTLQPERAVE